MVAPLEWRVDVNANVDNSDVVLRFYKKLAEKVHLGTLVKISFQTDSNDKQRKFNSEMIVQWAPAQKIEFNGDISMTLNNVRLSEVRFH